jgi:cell wall-associated NlpC family hydrolase
MNRQIFQACSNYVGKPYEDFNCWDLVRKLYQDVYNLDVHQDYGCDVPDREECESLIKTNKGEFFKSDKPEPGDIMLLRILGVECHIGMYLGVGKFIHSLKGNGVVIDSVSRYSTRVNGYYRHRSFS